MCEKLYEKQKIYLPDVKNARQLGGYTAKDGRKIKNNVLLRTGSLTDITFEGKRLLADVYSLKFIIDFRTSGERMGRADPEIEGAENIWISVMEDYVSDPGVSAVLSEIESAPEVTAQHIEMYDQAAPAAKVYKEILESESGRKGYKRFFDILMSAEGAVLWHCAKGKDRTGIAAVLFLSVMGVDEKKIVADYTMSNTALSHVRDEFFVLAQKEGCSKEAAQRLSFVAAGVDKKDILEALDMIKKNYGSVCEYVKQRLCMDESYIRDLREKYLE